MIVFNFIFNIPFTLNFLGVVSVGVRQNRPSLFTTNRRDEQREIQNNNANRITSETLDTILNAFSRALTNSNNVPNRANLNSTNSVPMLRRSASTGRLPNTSSGTNDQLAINSNFRRRINIGRGDGDH